MALRRPHAVLLDIGGTLLIELQAVGREQLVEGFLERIGFPHSAEEPLARVVERMEDAIARVHRTNRAPWRFRDWLVEGLGGDVDCDALEIEAFRAFGRFAPMPGARAALDALAAAGVATAAVSNAIFGAPALAAELARHDLRAPLRFVLSSAEVGVRKPDPAIFREALRRIGSQPERTWFVGDSRENDVAGARGAGLTAVWFRRDAEAGSGTEAEPGAPVDFAVVSGWSAFVDLFRGTSA